MNFTRNSLYPSIAPSATVRRQGKRIKNLIKKVISFRLKYKGEIIPKNKYPRKYYRSFYRGIFRETRREGSIILISIIDPMRFTHSYYLKSSQARCSDLNSELGESSS